MPAKIHGNLGSVAPAAATDADLYTGGTVPASRKATGTLTVCNTGAAATFRFAVINGSLGSVAKNHYREYETPIAAAGSGGNVEKTGIPLKAGDRLLVRASTADVAFNFDGIEEDA